MGKNATALITGASGGLGQELCREFARNSYDLIITARDPAKLRVMAAELRKTYGVRVAVIAADLNQEDAPRQLYEKTRAAGVEVDVLVNNAGFGLGGPFVRSRPRLHSSMIRVNILAPTRLCRLFLPGMLERGRGGILNVASTGAFVAGPGNAVYCATKAYLLSLTEALADELRDTPVVVSAVCPGAIHTGFAHRANMETTPLFNYGVMHPGQVARQAYEGFFRGRPVTVVGLLNQLLIGAVRLLPRCVAVHGSGLIQRQYAVKTPCPDEACNPIPQP